MPMTTTLTAAGYVVNLDTPSQVPGFRLAVDGNSIAAVAGPPSSAALTPQDSAGFVNWMLAYLEQKLRFVDNVAVSGRTTLQCLANLGSWVPGTTANVLLFLEGTNSIAGYVAAGMTDAQAADQAIIDLQLYLAAVKSFNKFRRIIVPTITPRGATLARNAAHDRYNRQLVDLLSRDGIYVIPDHWSVCIDRSSNTMSALANYLRQDDALHPTPKGARWLGKESARAVAAALPLPPTRLIPVSSITRALSSDSLFINSNPLLLGADTGTYLGSSPLPTGPVKAGWRAGYTAGAPTVVCSNGTDPNGYGGYQQIAVTGAAAATLCAIATNNTEALTYVAAGDYLKPMYRVTWSGLSGVQAIFTRMSGNFPGALSVEGFASNSPAYQVAGDFDQADLTEPFVMTGPATRFSNSVPPNTTLSTLLGVLWAGAGGGTIRITQAGFINLGQSPSEL